MTDDNAAGEASSYALQLAEALTKFHNEVFFAATVDETRDQVFQIYQGISAPVAEVNAETGDVEVLSRISKKTYNISTPKGMKKLVSQHINWNWPE